MGRIGRRTEDTLPPDQQEGWNADGTFEHAPDTGRIAIEGFPRAERAGDCRLALAWEGKGREVWALFCGGLATRAWVGRFAMGFMTTALN
jgi:hypothetical protein